MMPLAVLYTMLPQQSCRTDVLACIAIAASTAASEQPDKFDISKARHALHDEHAPRQHACLCARVVCRDKEACMHMAMQGTPSAAQASRAAKSITNRIHVEDACKVPPLLLLLVCGMHVLADD